MTAFATARKFAPKAAMASLLSLWLSGCAVLAGAGAGYVAADEISEGDGEADVLEDVRGEGNGRN